MSAVQFISKDNAMPGDRVREAERPAALERMPVLMRRADGAGFIVRDGDGERFVALAQIDAILRVISYA